MILKQNGKTGLVTLAVILAAVLFFLFGTQTGKDLMSGAKDVTESTMDKAGDVAGAAGDMVKDGAEATKDMAGDAMDKAGEMTDAAGDMIEGGVDSAKEMLKTDPDALEEAKDILEEAVEPVED